jgi:site-specific DNA-methyltransferase (adenine-specific)
MPNDLIVTKVDRARMLLAEARDATDCKQVADVAKAAEVYARRQKLGQEAVEYAHAVVIDAQTMMGELLKAGPKNTGAKGRRGGGTRGSKKEPRVDAPSTLSELGIGKKESSDAQALARLKEEAPEAYEEVRTGKKKVSQARRVLDREDKRKQMAAAAAAAPRNGEVAWEIRHGDSLVRLPEIEEASVPHILADSPYNVGVNYGSGVKADRLSDEEFLAWCRLWVAECVRVLAPHGTMWVLMGDEYADYMGVILREAGLHRRAWIKWYETFGNCNSAGTNFNRCSRHLFYCVKDPRRFTFHPEAVNRPSDRQAKYGDARADPDGKIWDDVWVIPRLVGTAKERIPEFPTQLPLALVRPIIACSSNPGDLILDPFCGSATAGVAAVELGRRFIGIEVQKKFVELARLRLRGMKERG